MFHFTILLIIYSFTQQKLSREYDKNYNYPKHHFLAHLPFDLQVKGTTENYTTRPGEGFQQEVQQAYNQTNFRDTEQQVLYSLFFCAHKFIVYMN